jgi:hypothetical protein
MNTQSQAVQMSTPVSSLPLKTTQDVNEIEDPLIQNVLKEFENEYGTPNLPQQTLPENVNIPIVEKQQPMQQQYHQPRHLQYNKENENNNIIDMQIVQKTLIISIITIIFINTDIVNLLNSKLPESIAKHVTGKEFLLKFVLIFVIFYILIYMKFL